MSHTRKSLVRFSMLEAEIALCKATGYSGYNADIQHILALVQQFQDNHYHSSNNSPVLTYGSNPVDDTEQINF